jgi:hypothetical protein
MFTPEEHASAGTEDHQHLPDEQRQEDQPVVDPNESIELQSEQNGKEQNGAGDHETSERTNVRGETSVLRRNSRWITGLNVARGVHP